MTREFDGDEEDQQRGHSLIDGWMTHCLLPVLTAGGRQQSSIIRESRLFCTLEQRNSGEVTPEVHGVRFHCSNRFIHHFDTGEAAETLQVFGDVAEAGRTVQAI